MTRRKHREQAWEFVGDAATAYHQRYANPRSVDARLHQLEAAEVKSLLPGGSKFEHHDFACGTGRWLRELAYQSNARWGYDISADMLRLAGDIDANLVDLSASPAAVPPGDERRLVTSFRFLLNADDRSRAEFWDFARRLLPDSSAGLLLFNVHGSGPSLRSLSAWVRRAPVRSLGHRETLAMARDEGFDCIAWSGVQLFPSGMLERLAPLISVEALWRSLPGSRWLSINRTYVCSRTSRR